MNSVSTFRTRVAVAAMLALAIFGLCPSALAGATTTVTFQPNNPWAQEVGSVDHYDASHDYSVAVPAGKTLHIKLYTRNPNVFLKITNETSGKKLVDTMQTGATTWSQDFVAASTVKVHVYVDPATMVQGDSSKYALQVGVYGANDMRPASTAVTFQPGNPWAQELGRIDSGATAHDYTVAVAAGNTLQANLIAKDSNLHFKVLDANQAVLFDSTAAPAAAGTTAAATTPGESTWSTPVTAAATYTIRVYADPASVPQGAAFGYALQVGQYPTNRAVPASGASSAAPATSAMPAGSAAPAVPAASATPAAPATPASSATR